MKKTIIIGRVREFIAAKAKERGLSVNDIAKEMGFHGTGNVPGLRSGDIGKLTMETVHADVMAEHLGEGILSKLVHKPKRWVERPHI